MNINFLHKVPLIKFVISKSCTLLTQNQSRTPNDICVPEQVKLQIKG